MAASDVARSTASRAKSLRYSLTTFRDGSLDLLLRRVKQLDQIRRFAHNDTLRVAPLPVNLVNGETLRETRCDDIAQKRFPLRVSDFAAAKNVSPEE